MSPDERTIRRLIGVYNADGSIRGELTYFVGARLGRAHCSLCDITHGLVRERADWRTCRASMPVPFDTYHRDDEPAEARAAHRGELPIVLAETSDGFIEPDSMRNGTRMESRVPARLPISNSVIS